MGLFAWATQCSGGLAFVAVLCLSIWVLSNENGLEPAAEYPLAGLSFMPGRAFWNILFAYYCLVIHLMVTGFSTRSLWGISDMIGRLRDSEKARLLRGVQSSLRRPPSIASLSSSETLTQSSSASSESGDFDLEKYSADTTPATEAVIHAIIIPNYKEELDTLTETLDVLASHPQARDCYDVRACPEHGCRLFACLGEPTRPMLRLH
jgi:hypothetical protein